MTAIDGEHATDGPYDGSVHESGGGGTTHGSMHASAYGSAPTSTYGSAHSSTRGTGWTVSLTVGAALALCACNLPSWWRQSPLTCGLITLGALLVTLWGAAAVSERPTAASMLWPARATRHRNTVFAAACTVAAGIGGPPLWLSAVDAFLLVAYLLCLDALSAGPVGARQLRRIGPAAAALAATAAVWAAAWAPVTSSAALGRIVGAVGVAAAGLAAGSAFWIRRTARG